MLSLSASLPLLLQLPSLATSNNNSDNNDKTKKERKVTEVGIVVSTPMLNKEKGGRVVGSIAKVRPSLAFVRDRINPACAMDLLCTVASRLPQEVVIV